MMSVLVLNPRIKKNGAQRAVFISCRSVNPRPWEVGQQVTGYAD